MAGPRSRLNRPGAFGWALAATALVALAVRLVYALVLVGDDPLLGDGLEFHLIANLVADGHGYIQPFVFQDGGGAVPTADKPPLYPLLLAAVSAVGGRGYAWHHLVGVGAGTAAVVAIGFLGRRVAGERTGLLAAGIAALYPPLIGGDGSLRSESLVPLLVSLLLLAAYRLRERLSLGRAAVFGALVGAAALTRSELVLLGLLALPALAPHMRREAVRAGAIAAVACVVVLTPWLARTWIALDHPVFVSTNLGGLIAGANCPSTYHGPLLGQWNFRCLPPTPPGNEVEASARLRRHGVRYAREHAGRLPVVVAARVGRTWELFRPGQQAAMLSVFEGRNRTVARAGVPVYWALALLAIWGALALRRRREPLILLAAPLVLVTLVSAAAYGFTRFRSAAEASIVVLAAVALDDLIRRLADRRARRAPPPAAQPPA